MQRQWREYEKLVPCGPMDHRHRPPSSGGILTVLCSELPMPVVHAETRPECTQKQGQSGHRNKASIQKQKYLIGSSRMGNGEHPPTELVLVEKQNKTDNFIQYNKPFLIASPLMAFFYCPPVQCQQPVAIGQVHTTYHRTKSLPVQYFTNRLHY